MEPVWPELLIKPKKIFELQSTAISNKKKIFVKNIFLSLRVMG
jgi:hypothetical protein